MILRSNGLEKQTQWNHKYYQARSIPYNTHTPKNIYKVSISSNTSKTHCWICEISIKRRKKSIKPKRNLERACLSCVESQREIYHPLLYFSLSNLQETHADCHPRSSVVVVSPLFFSFFLICSLYLFLSVEKPMAKKFKWPNCRQTFTWM